MRTAIGQLSSRFIQVAGQQAIRGITPTSSTFGPMKARINTEAGSTQTPQFNFLESEELAPIKQMYTALRDFSRKFDHNGIAAKEVNQFSTACYNMQIAKGSDEVGLIRSLAQSSLTKSVKLLKTTIHPNQKPSPETIQAFNKLTSLQDETIEFIVAYKRGENTD